MRERLAALSDRAEFWLVVTLSFGWFVTSSTASLLLRETTPEITDAGIFGLLAYEVLVFVAVLAIGRARGWTITTLGFRASAVEGLVGVLVFALTYLFLSLLYQAVLSLGVSPLRAPLTSPALSWGSVILLSIINPLFEETLVAAYVIRATEKDGAFFAIGASTLLRLLYHTYQGPSAALFIAPLGVLFALFYWRTRRVFPLVVAHAILDFIALAPMVRQ